MTILKLRNRKHHAAYRYEYVLKKPYINVQKIPHSCYYSKIVDPTLFMLDSWHEIWEVMKCKPSRTLLTGLGVAWGIFILTLLVGIGAGFEDGVFKLFEGFSKRTTYLFSSETSKEYKGTKKGEMVRFERADIDLIKREVSEITLVSPEITQMERVSSLTGNGSFDVRGVFPDYFDIKILEMEKGRLLNALDTKGSRNNVIIGKNVATVLFNHENPIGKNLRIKDTTYKVVGVIKNTLLSNFEERVIYVPFTSYIQNIMPAKEFSTIIYTIRDDADTKKINKRIRSVLARRKHIAPNDDKAFYFNSMEEQINAFNKLFTTLNKFLWLMGISTLLSGVIGVGNIMYTSAKERTREIGIRKSVGAKPSTIKTMIVCESVALTSIAGYVGIILGWLCLKGVGLFITKDTIMMDKPHIDMPIAIGSVILLVMAGTVAGLKPALYASKLSPIDALKDEN